MNRKGIGIQERAMRLRSNLLGDVAIGPWENDDLLNSSRNLSVKRIKHEAVIARVASNLEGNIRYEKLPLNQSLNDTIKR